MKLKEKIISLIPIYGSRYFKRKAEQEIKAGEAGIVYNAPGQNDPDGKKFQDFLTKLPKYCIQDTFFASKKRSLMKIVGAEYRQIVFIDKSGSPDKTLYVRLKGQYFIHNGGTYFWPCVSEKLIVYYDLVDSRPLIDLTNDPDWYNPESFAEVVTAVTNTKAMGAWSEDSIEKIVKMLWILIIAIGIVGLISIVIIIQNNNANKEMLELLKKIAERVVS